MTGAIADGGDAAPDDSTTTASPGDVLAPLTGTVTSWLVDEGDRVERGTPVATLEAMKMETQVMAPVSGVIHRTASIGDLVDYGEPMGRVE
jgi:acetyl-CoA/propionyl-CoA carboxylase biotin carboxyl carrier protein